MRRLSWALAGLAAILLIAFGSFLWIAQSDWLREKIRASIVEQTEKASGGKVELGAVTVDWRGLNARLDRFVIHGREAEGQAPLVAVERVNVRLKIISLLRRDISISGIDAVQPQVHVVIAADGSTNIPAPKLASRNSIPQRILDLKIATFNVSDGMFLVDAAGAAPRRIPWNIRGKDLNAAVNYDPVKVRYSGHLALGSLRAMALDLQLAADASFERDRITVPHATVKTTGSSIDLKDFVLQNFASPSIVTHYEARLSLGDMAGLLPAGYKTSGAVAGSGDASFRSLADYSLKGEVHGDGINLDQFRNLRFTSHIDADPQRISLSGLRANVLGGEFTGSIETHDLDTFHAAGHIAHFDLAEAARLKTRQPLPYNGLVSGTVDAKGRLNEGRLRGFGVDAQLAITPAPKGAPVKGNVAVHYDAASGKINFGQSWLDLPHTHVELSGIFGDRLNVKMQSTDSKDLSPLLNAPLSFASLSFAGTVSGPPANPLIAGQATATDAQFGEYRIQSFSGDITASRSNATASHAEVVFGDIRARGAGSVQLTDWAITPASPITATADVTESNLANLLDRLGHKEVAISGALTASARITGTVGSPLADADVALTKGFIYAQPFDSISGKLQVVNRNSQGLTGVFVSGPKRINITARFEHTGTQFPAGTLDFNLTSNTMPLNEIALVRQRQPDIHGFGKFHADGSLKISHDSLHQIQFSLTSLNADASANGLELYGRTLGDARFVAQTRGDVLTGQFDSNAASASIHGDGTMQLIGDYEVKGGLTFTNAGLNSLVALILKSDDAKGLNFDGTAEGQVDFHGPALKPAQIAATFNIPRVELHALPGSQLAETLPGYSITNVGPIRATLLNGSVRLDRARFKAPETDVTLEGALALNESAPLNLRVQGTVNAALAQTMNPDLRATGAIALDATVHGAWASPDVSGRATIRNGDFHYADFSNGLSNANGEVSFTGTRATIRSFTAESGGGKVDASGFAAITNGLLSFRVEAQARAVRVRYPEGISSVSDAALTFAGTSQRSETSGVITVHRVTINPKSDAATILANTVEPTETAAARNGLAANMNLDVQISTAPDVALQTSVTQSLQADAQLRLRGTATNPALLGRINITQGEMVFFGNKYSINTGSISFYNPAKIDPVLNIDLETKARGVDVILTVSGPITKLNVSYRSDPPLQFSDIVALLATGRAPGDPTLALQNTGQSQNFQQLGASTLIGQALANPVAGRLQRFFGVSRLKIDPSLTGITGSPEARLTIEQQVTPEILFTYITDVSSTSTQLIRVEWSFNRHWSAILIREENGYVGLDFAYKKRFK